MNRISIALLAGLLGFFGYVGLVTIIADSVLTLHWGIQALYFVIVGTVWVFPMRWLMLWAAGQR